MKRRCSRAWVRAGLALLAGLLATDAGAASPPPAVTVQPIEVKDVGQVLTFPGQVQAIQSVNIVARVAAYMVQMTFKEGSMVKTGQPLYQLQKGPYEAVVKQAQGSLAQAQASLRNAQLNYERDSKAGNLAISDQQVQQDVAARDVAAGQVAAAMGTLESAAIDLGYCDVVSPIDGRIGRTQYTIGNLVQPSSGALATVVQVDPIRVAFAAADAQVLQLQQSLDTTQDGLKEAVMLQVQLPNGAAYAHPGTIEFLNNQVDAGTGTLTIWGRFANPEGQLIPGAYVTVTVRQTTPDKRPVVPIQAVQNDQQGQFVLLVGADNKVEQRKVTTGRQVDQDFVVESGLSGGERVITEGVQKARPGEAVNPSTPTASGSASKGGG